MHWELTDEQRMFREALRAWLTGAAPADAVRRWEDAEDPEPYERVLVGEHWAGAGTPEDLGGEGGGLIELALAAEEFGRVTAPSSAWLATVLAMPAMAGLADVTTSVLGKGSFAALAVPAGSPPDDAGSAGRGVSFDGERIDGAVATVLGADRAANLVVPVRTPDDVQLVLVEAAAAGVSISPRRLLDRSRTVADVEFTRAEATPLHVDAAKMLARAALRAAVLVSADALGSMSRMLELATDYSAQRHQFGVPIGSFQAVKHAAATILVSVEAARSITYFAAASVDGGNPEAALHAAAAKAQVTGDAGRCADSALTMHGAIGYTWEYDLQLLYKRAKLDAFLFGSPTEWNERLAALLPLLPA